MRCKISRLVSYFAQGAKLVRFQAVRSRILRVFKRQVTEEVLIDYHVITFNNY